VALTSVFDRTALYGALADLVLVLHFAFLLFVVGGGLLLFRWRRLVWLHLPVAAWGVLVELAGWICPLTPLENRFRELSGGSAYQESFIEHYVTAILYPEGLTRTIQVGLGLAALFFNVVVYWRRFGRPRGAAR